MIDLTKFQLYTPVAKDIAPEYFKEYVLYLMKYGDAAAICFLRGC